MYLNSCLSWCLDLPSDIFSHFALFCVIKAELLLSKTPPVSEPPPSLCRMGIFWHWVPWGVDRWETEFLSSKNRLQPTAPPFLPSHRLWVCQESDFLCVQLWSWSWDAQDAPNLGQRDGKFDLHPVVLTPHRTDLCSVLSSRDHS